ncbi:MAG: 1-deoxy-D-xylulose-5-phosphate reductoisomerase [Treponema sp.]|jgi:1-deoxy-D-xylulose-5-phosphate reductoisomerase|nr:1-deoxy-D-xylulose-5-phosphate reductoisomerase [Treponema sp.]
MKVIAILGATGSIGKSTLDVIRKNPDCFEPVLFSAYTDGESLLQLGKEYPNARLALAGNVENAPEAIHYTGREGLLRAIKECAQSGGAHVLVVNGIAGAAGLEPSLAAIDVGMDLALANKETIVMAGEVAIRKAREKNVNIIPVDSEHSAVFQLLRAHADIVDDAISGNLGAAEKLDSIILTASGGPFRALSSEQLARVKPKDALAHPTWKMGAKITIDSASMANKGLEVIEAVKLFAMPPDKVKVVVHPQSVVHSMIRFVDGSIYAQLSKPDMRRPIQDALFFPNKGMVSFDNFDMTSVMLEFEAPDEKKFPLLPLAYRVAKARALYPVAYNAANEEAASLFLEEKIGFLDIAHIVESVLQRDWTGAVTVDAVWEADRKARSCVYELKNLLFAS